MGGGRRHHAALQPHRPQRQRERAGRERAGQSVDPDGTHHVFYVADNAHVIELTWQTQDEPVARDLTAHGTSIGPAPVAISANQPPVPA